LAFITVSIVEFIEQIKLFPVLDVRAPTEYTKGHIPGSISFPLLTDEERAKVGTIYKQNSRQDAIKVGLEIFGPKMRSMVEDVENNILHSTSEDNKTVLLHCWRGGMRSGGVAWLLDFYGFTVITLDGGYKKFRNWVLEQFTKEYDIKILGGYTGSGKTHILHEIQKNGLQVIDLEGLAHHKGSTFGNIGMPEQPSQEMFENLLALQLYNASKTNRTIWIEDESQRLGHVCIPNSLWKQLNTYPTYFLNIPFEERLDFIVAEYGELDQERLHQAILRIKKRLGGLETTNAIELLKKGDIKESFKILLTYYDKYYAKSFQKKSNTNNLIKIMECENIDATKNCASLLNI